MVVVGVMGNGDRQVVVIVAGPGDKVASARSLGDGHAVAERRAQVDLLGAGLEQQLLVAQDVGRAGEHRRPAAPGVLAAVRTRAHLATVAVVGRERQVGVEVALGGKVTK